MERGEGVEVEGHDGVTIGRMKTDGAERKRIEREGCDWDCDSLAQSVVVSKVVSVREKIPPDGITTSISFGAETVNEHCSSLPPPPVTVCALMVMFAPLSVEVMMDVAEEMPVTVTPSSTICPWDAWMREWASDAYPSLVINPLSFFTSTEINVASEGVLMVRSEGADDDA